MQSAKPSKLQWLWQHSCVSLLVVLIFSCIVELVVFNHHFFFGGSPYARSAIELPFTPQLNAKAVVLSPQHNVLTLDHLAIKARNLKVKLGSAMNDSFADFAITAVVEIKDRHSAPNFRPVAKLYLNPNALGQDEAIAHFRVADDQVQGVRLTFTGSSSGWIAILNEASFNVPEHLSVSYLRIALLFFVLGAVYLTLRYRLYLLRYDHRKKRHRALNYVVITVCLGISFLEFLAISPHNTKMWAFDVFGDGLMIYTNEKHQILQDYPRTQEEISNSDAYTQLLDAFLKGQLNIDVYVDPKLEQLEDIYDFSERTANNIRFTWDRPYHDGKYFVYFGMAPMLMAHAPIYFLTGKIPSVALAGVWLTSLAILSMLWGLRTMVLAMVARPNMLLYLGAQVAAVGGALVWYLQIGMSHYFMPYLTGIFWLGILVGSLYSLFTPLYLLENRDEFVGRGSHLKPWQRRSLLVLAGVAIVLIVMSRPLSLLMALVLSLPAVWWLFKENYSAKLLPFVRDAAFAVVPVLVGACFVMWYNYVRFDSITEFGQLMQITGDNIPANALSLELSFLRNSTYYFLFEPLTYLNEFPFVRPALTHYPDTGDFLYLTDRVALMAIPLMWALVLIVFPLRAGGLLSSTSGGVAGTPAPAPVSISSSDSPAAALFISRGGLLRVILWCFVPSAVFLAFAMYSNAGVSGRYCSDINCPAAYLAVVALLRTMQAPPHRSLLERCAYVVLYVLSLWFLVKTVLISVLICFNSDANNPLLLGSMFNDMNPELIVFMQRTFMPLLW